MPLQTSTTGQLANAMKEMIPAVRYATEHNTVMENTGMVEHFQLQKGTDTLVVPTVARMTASPVTEGVDLTDSADIGMTTVSVTASRIALKVIVTDDLIFQLNDDVFRMIGRQMGDAIARRKDEDGVALFSGFSRDWGIANQRLTSAVAHSLIFRAKSNRVGEDMRFVGHPGTIRTLSSSLTTLGNATPVAIPEGFTASRLQKFWTGIMLNMTPFFQTGNVSRDASGDSVNGFFDKSALGMLTHVGYLYERDRDNSLFAWEVIASSRYNFFEIDDNKGVGFTADSADPTTTAT